MSQQDSRPESDTVIVWGVLCLVAVGFLFWLMIPNYVKEPSTSPANACINNMRQIQAAKNEWALETGKTNGDIVPTENDITPYIQLNRYGKIPPCPSGGTYTLGKLSELPKCSIGTNAPQPHVLTPEPEGGNKGTH